MHLTHHVLQQERPGIGSSHPKDQKPSKPIKATVRINPSTIKITSEAAAGLKKKPKALSTTSVTTRSAVANSKVYTVADLPCQEKRKKNIYPPQEIKLDSRKTVALAQTTDISVPKGKITFCHNKVAVQQEISASQDMAVSDGDSEASSLKSAPDQADASILSEMDCR